MKKSIFLFFVIALSIYSSLQAQEHQNHLTTTVDEKNPGLEIVVSALIIYSPEHSNSDLATELHLTYWTSHTWAYGFSYTVVFEEDNRIGHELAVIVSHKPWSFLTINTGPSFSLPNAHKDTEISAYLEGEFAFKIGNFHTGPTVGTLIGEELKFFGGLHISYEF